MLSRHNILKYDSTLRFFLTCENTQEFERHKNDPSGYFSNYNSRALGALSELKIRDAFNFMYSSVKSYYFDNTEPPEFQMQHCKNL